MIENDFAPFHLNADVKDFEGNGGIGRYIFLPGSDGRAKEIAQFFNRPTLKSHERGHNLYLGTLTHNRKKIDVAAVSTGMGCPSMEIILHELFNLGAKRFLRVGTAGSLQPDFIFPGTLINVQAAVRDEDTSRHYAPVEVPAVASLEMISSILLASEKLELSEDLFTGVVHCKSALFAREMTAGPRSKENSSYLENLINAGVLASEMESAALFIQSQIYNHQLMMRGLDPSNRVLAGAILAVVTAPKKLAKVPEAENAIKNSIKLALETVKMLAEQELLG